MNGVILSRRKFLGGLLAAPAVVAASNLMPVRNIDRLLYPILHGDGVTDDAPALNAALKGLRYFDKRLNRLAQTTSGPDFFLDSGRYHIKSPIVIEGREYVDFGGSEILAAEGVSHAIEVRQSSDIVLDRGHIRIPPMSLGTTLRFHHL